MEEQYEEINLMEYLVVIWKRKWLIILPTLLCVIAAGVISFMLPQKWEVDAIIQPSKLFIQNQQGEFQEVVVTAPDQIASQINEESYNHLIAAELNLDLREYPELKAETIRNTNLVRISIREEDIQKAKSILLSLFKNLKVELDRKVGVEMKGIDQKVESKKNAIKGKELGIIDLQNQIGLEKLLIEDKNNGIKTQQNEIKKLQNNIKIKNIEIESSKIEKERIKKEIESLQNKFKISTERVTNIMDEMKSVKQGIDEIEEQLKKALAEKTTGLDAISLLLYSNEIQQNLRYYNTLDEKLIYEKLTQETLNFTIQDMKEEMKQIDNQILQIIEQIDSIDADIDNIKTTIEVIKTEINKINNRIDSLKNDIEKIKNDINTLDSEKLLLEDEKARIDYAALVKEPTSSLYPVSPRKKLYVAIAGFLGLMIFTILAFFIENIEKHKEKIGKPSLKE